jgi:RNase H-fold protein (predicted Holliday junction resolvase)
MNFMNNLKANGGVDVDVFYWDETRTSAECTAILRKYYSKSTQGKSQQEQYEAIKAKVDIMSATLILQNFLTHLRDLSQMDVT